MNKEQNLKKFKDMINNPQRTNVDRTLGIEIESLDPVVLRLNVDEKVFQLMGYLHGGVNVLLAESAASAAGCLEVDLEKEYVLGVEINANHLRSVQEGVIRAYPSLLNKTRTTMVMGIDIKDEEGRMVCVSRCTLMVREKRS